MIDVGVGVEVAGGRLLVSFSSLLVAVVKLEIVKGQGDAGYVSISVATICYFSPLSAPLLSMLVSYDGAIEFFVVCLVEDALVESCVCHDIVIDERHGSGRGGRKVESSSAAIPIRRAFAFLRKRP